MPINLGELLLKRDMITPQQWQEALDHQKVNGGPLDKAFVSLGFLQDADIRGALSRQYGVPTINLDHFEVDPAILKLIPAETARKYRILPLALHAKTLALAMADPTNVFAMDDIKFMTGYNVEPVVDLEAAVDEALHRYYDSGRSTEVAPPVGAAVKAILEEPTLTPDDLAAIGGLAEIDLDALAQADTESVVKFTNALFADSLKRRASEIHIEPYEKEFRVRFRIDGILYNVMALPMNLRDPLISRIKFMAKIKSGEKRFLQEGRLTIRMKVGDRSRELAFVVRCVHTLWGENIVLLDKSTLILDRTKAGFEPQSLERFENALAKAYGIVLVTGPRRSGTTNTLYSAIASLNRPDCNIFTVEDPVEFILPGINQVQVNEDAGATFPAVLRSFRRLDPDIIAVSEIRDAETMDLMLKLALNGRLVLSTLDTNDAPSTVSRLANMGIEPLMVGVAVNLIQAQRLVRRVCSKCKTDITAEVPSKTLIDIGYGPEVIGTFQLFRGRGCAACYRTGYMGGVGLFETMEVSEGIRDLIFGGATAAEIRKRALEEGMITLRMSGLEKIKQGVTTIEEVLRETVA